MISSTPKRSAVRNGERTASSRASISARKATGSSAAALGASAIIVATGGAAGLALLGYGAYRWLSKDKAKDKGRARSPSPDEPIIVSRDAAQGR